MLKKQIYTLIGLTLATILIVAGAWALKSGKLAGLADVIQQTTQKGVLVTAKDSSNNPISGVLIRAYTFIQDEPGQPNRWGEASYLNGNTDANGKYKIEGGSPICTETNYITKFRFTAEKANYTSTPAKSQEVVKTTFCSQLTTIAFTLSLGTPPAPGKAIIEGRVYDKSNNNSIEGAIVSIADADGVVLGKTTSDQNGNYDLPDISAGIDNTLKSSKANYDTYTSSLNLSAGKTYPIDIGMNPQGYQPPPPTQPDKNNFIFTAEVVDQDTQQLIKDVKVSIKINPAINGAVEAINTTKDAPVDTSKYGNNNLLAKVPYPSDCYSYNTKYTVEFSHPAYETQTLPDFYCSDISFSDNLQTYFYNAHRVLLEKKETFTAYGTLSELCGEFNQFPSIDISIFDESIPQQKYPGQSIAGDGYFEINSIPYRQNTNYKVIFSHSAYKDKTITFKGTDVKRLDDGSFEFEIETSLLEIEPLGRTCLLGEVRDTDTKEPIIGAWIWVSDSSGILTQYKVRTNSEGHYQIALDKAGLYTVFVFHYAYYDGDGAKKEINVKENQINKLDFDLKFIIERNYYDLNIELLDDLGNPINIPDDIDPTDIQINISDIGNQQIYFPDRNDFEIRQEGDKSILRVANLYCGRKLKLSIDISCFFERNGGKFKLSRLDLIQYDCPETINEFDRLIRLNKLSSNEDKPQIANLYGWINLESCEDTLGCNVLGEGEFYCNPQLEPIELELVSVDGKNQNRKTNVYASGYYQFIDVPPGRYSLNLNSQRYILDSWYYNREFDIGDKDKKENVGIEIKPEYKSEARKKKSIKGIEFFFIGPIAQKYMEEGIDWNAVASKYASIKDNLNNNFLPEPGLIPIYVCDYAGHKIGYAGSSMGCAENGPFVGPRIIIPSSTIMVNDMESAVIHEYGHHVFIKGGGDYSDYEQLRNLLNAANNFDQSCVFASIEDSNISALFDYNGHPYDDEHEFFASLFNAYFNHHDRLLALINSLPEGSDCRNILEFAWYFFAKKVAQTPPAENPSAVQGAGIRLYPNDDEIFGPVVGGKIGNNIYTPDQIAKGLWKQSVYDGLKPIQKAQLKASLAYRRTLNYLKIDPEKYRNQIDINVVKFNSFIDKMLGARGDRGSIEGVVKEQNGGPKIPKENAIVIIGKKMAATDKDGKFKIENIKTGEQRVRVIDGKTSKNLHVDLETVNIQKGKTIRRYFTVN